MGYIVNKFERAHLETLLWTDRHTSETLASCTPLRIVTIRKFAYSIIMVFRSTLGAASNEFGYNEHKAMTSNFSLREEQFWLTLVLRKLPQVTINNFVS